MWAVMANVCNELMELTKLKEQGFFTDVDNSAYEAYLKCYMWLKDAINREEERIITQVMKNREKNNV